VVKLENQFPSDIPDAEAFLAELEISNRYYNRVKVERCKKRTPPPFPQCSCLHDVPGNRYELEAVTYWTGNKHYTSCFKVKSRWYYYDGLAIKHGKGLQPYFGTPGGYTLSHCVFVNTLLN
jgi:hypothetical protein